MTHLSHRSPCFSFFVWMGSLSARSLFLLAMMGTLAGTAFAATPTPTSTTLAISATSVPYKTPITLTATVVTAANAPVTTGLVLFCEATAKFCENNSALGIAQLTFPAATASVKIGSGPIGNHSYKAVFRANNTYASSQSNTVTYTVAGTYSSTTTLASSGSIGNYTLNATVEGVDSLAAGPTGTISFLDSSTGNSLLGTEKLSVSTLSTTFIQLQPFAIGISTTNRSVAIASAYLNADNNLDVVTADEPANGNGASLSTISVLLGNGDGSFQPKVNYTGCNKGESALRIVLADFNRDGTPDIALACSDGTNGGLVIILGNGDGSFSSPTFYPTGDAASIAIGDFNNDGLLDIALTDNSQQNVDFFKGKGDGTFTQETTTLSAPSNAHGIVVADFNGDGFDDVAYAVTSSTSSLSDLYLALGNGTGAFQQPSTAVATQIGEFLTVGDTNADDFPDVVATTITRPPGQPFHNVGPSLYVLLGKGNGTFQPTATYTSDIPSDPHLADVNGDGIPDIIAGGSTGALVYQGNGDGTFQPYQEPNIGGFALTYAVNAGDYNNDGNADLIGTDADSPHAAVSLSNVQQISVASALTKVAVFPLGSGVHNVDASYSGDAIFIGSLSSTVPLTAAPVNTALVLSASATSSILSGQSIVLTADLSPYTVGPPTTTTNNELVKFYSGTTLLGSGKLSNGVATITTTALPIGADSLTAVYGGDSNYNPSTSNAVTATVSNVLISSSPNPSTYTQTVTFTGTVATGKTGTIIFFDGSTNIGSSVISGTTATITTSSLTAGSHNITAQYNSNTSPVLVQVVKKATPTVTVTTSGPSTYGQTVTITASVPTGATGSVTFTSGSLTLGTGTISSGSVSITTSVLTVPSDLITATYGGDTNYNSAVGTATQTVSKANTVGTLTSSVNPSLPGSAVTFTDTLPTNVIGTVTFTSGSTLLGTSAITNGVATTTTSTLPLGSDLITATYNGDTNNNGSTATLTQVVAKSTPTLTVSTSGPSIFGQSVSITASVPNGPTGTITITSGGVTLGSGTITASSGTVTITTKILPVGPNTITATYGGDAANNSATGTTTQTVSKASPTATLSSSVNPSIAGQAVTFTASLPANSTGAVTITAGSTILGSPTLANGVASVTTSMLPVGSAIITATYNGDSNNNTANATLTQVVNKATPTVSVTTSGPSTFGNSVSITASVSGGATGTVTFTSGGVTLGSGTINPATNTAAIATTVLPVGSDLITATYGGDANNNSAQGTVTQTVTKAGLTINLVSSLNPSNLNQSVTFTATLPSSVTGSVTFTNGTTVLGTSTLASGTAAVSTSSLPGGPDTITATYNGDPNNGTATASLVQTVNKTTPPITVTTSGPSTFGGSVTITTNLPPGTTGTVTVTSGGVTLGSGPVNPTTGTATITTTSLPVGSDPITATYGGDTNNNPATGTTTQTVTKASPAETLSSSINPSAPNQSVVFTATLPSNVTGTVTFTSGAIVLGTTNVTNGVATVATSTLAAGTDTITATYNGDSNNNTATASLVQTVNKTTPPITVTTSGPSTSGGSVTITTTLPPGTTGTVTVTSGGVTLGSGPVNPTTGTVTITTTSLPVGSDPITATYGGDTNNNPATATTTQIVSKANPTVTLISSTNPSNPGQAVTFTATLPSGVTGTVTFTSGTTSLGTATLAAGVATVMTSTLTTGSDLITATYSGDNNNNSATGTLTQVVGKSTPPVTVTTSGPSTFGGSVTITTTLPPGTTGTVTITSGGVTLGSGSVNPTTGTVVISTTSLPVGTDTITASYGGDTNNNPATGSATQIVTKATPSVTLTSSANPSTVGQSITFTATLSANVTGTVTFLDGSAILGTSTVNNGTAILITSTLTAGSHTITASFGGDTNNSPAVSAPLTQTVNKQTPVLPPPAVSSSNPPPNTPVTITETVPPGVTGTITFSDGSNPLGTAPIVGGVATITVPSLPQGSNSITAFSSGDANYNPATSLPTVVTVGKAATVVTLTSSVNPSAASQSVTFSASVHAGATGSVVFLDGATILGTGTINAAGVASFATSTLTIGTHPITASYGGDSNYDPATSALLVQTVSKIPTLITIAESTSAQLTNGGVTFTATVTASSPNATGTVTFMDGSVVLGTQTITANGGVAVALSTNANAILLTSSLVTGSHQIVAVYSGDSTFAPSTSAPMNYLVEDFTNTNTGAASQNIFPGASTTYTFSLAPVTAATFLNDVNVTVTGLPPGSTYTFTPSNVAAGSGVTAIVLNVQTSSNLSAQNRQPSNSPASRNELPVALGMLGLVGLGAIRKLRNKIPRTLLLLLLTLSSLLPIAALSGCAGGYFTLNPQTYTVTVTGAEGPIQHAATATLVVQ
jgi:Bacterial Ig-like domain (group 3)/FG-GAP-like repeat